MLALPDLTDVLFHDRSPIFEENVFKEPHPPEPHQPRHKCEGKLFASVRTPTEIKELIKEACDELFPPGDSLDEIKKCTDAKQYDDIIKKYESSLDTFNYAIFGLGSTQKHHRTNAFSTTLAC